METKRFKVGDRAIVVGDNSDHCFAQGTIVIISELAEEGYDYIATADSGDYWWIVDKDLKPKNEPMKTAAEEIRESIAELEKRIDGLTSQVKSATIKIGYLKVEAAKLTEPERIRVPENIKFEEWDNGFALISPNGKCIMFVNALHGGIPRLHPAGREGNLTADIITDPLYLEPCKRDDLKCGDVAIVVSEGMSNNDIINAAGNIENYSCILNDKDAAGWRDQMSVYVDTDEYDEYEFWYKVVR
jgi:hypothetical protein